MPRPYLHGYIANDEGELADVSEQGGDDTSMISTPRDIGRFFAALFSGRLLPPAQLRQMLTVPDVPLALTRLEAGRCDESCPGGSSVPLMMFDDRLGGALSWRLPRRTCCPARLAWRRI